MANLQAADVSVLREAQRNLANCKLTTYQHTTEIDEAHGSYKCDCSAFVSHVLSKVSPAALAAVESRSKKHPLAVDYYEHFAAAPLAGDAKAEGEFRRIPKLADAEPGDIIAWRKAEVVKGETTGHVMVLAAKPAREANGEFRIVVIDSTGKIHADDTRKEGETGLGRGTLWVKVDAAGAPTGLRVNAADGPLSSHPIAIGRLADGR